MKKVFEVTSAQFETLTVGKKYHFGNEIGRVISKSLPASALSNGITSGLSTVSVSILKSK